MMNISVVIPCYNRKEYLLYSLVSYSMQTFPSERFEVIVIDDGSSDGTISAIESQQWGFHLRTIRTDSNMGSSHARNLGIQHASGTLVVFSDSDMIVPADFLENHWNLHQACPRRVVSAPYRHYLYTLLYPEHIHTSLWKRMLKTAPELQLRLPDHFSNSKAPVPILLPDDIQSGYAARITPPHISRIMEDFMASYPDMSDCPLPWLSYTSSNSSVLRKSLLEIGGFDENFRYRHEDRDLSYRLHLSDHKFHLAREIVSIHQEHRLQQERRDMDTLASLDLVTFLQKYPTRDIFLFGLYQLSKKMFNYPMFSKLKKQLAEIETMNGSGKSAVSLFEQLLRSNLAQLIGKPALSDSLRSLKGWPENPAAYLLSNKETFNGYSSYPEFMTAVDFLLN